MTEEKYESFTDSQPRLAAAMNDSFSVESEESDDFIVIDLVSSGKETPSSPNAPVPSSPASPAEAKKEVKYDDYVELFTDDANVSCFHVSGPAVICSALWKR